jgi:hypothetical protein
MPIRLRMEGKVKLVGSSTGGDGGAFGDFENDEPAMVSQFDGGQVQSCGEEELLQGQL